MSLRPSLEQLRRRAGPVSACGRAVLVCVVALAAGRAASCPPSHAREPLTLLPPPVRSARPQAPRQDGSRLKAGEPVERPLAGGETHVYRVTLEAGQFLKATVDQRGIDVLLRLHRPDGQKLVEIDSPNSSQGPEIVFALADAPGDYRLEVTSLSKNVPPGRYEAKVEAQRAATAGDGKIVEAQAAYAEAQRLRAQNSADARRQAIERLEGALVVWRETGETFREAHTLSLIASTYRRLGQPRDALDYWNRTLEVLRPLNERREEATALNNIAIVYGELGESHKSFENYERVIALWRAAGDVYAEAKVHNNLGLAYNLQGEPRRALEHLNRALSVWQTTGNRQQEAVTVHNIGGTYEVSGDLQQALEFYSRALALYRSEGDRGGEAEDLNSIGGIHHRLGENQRALDYFGQALALWRSIGDRRREAYTLSNIGGAHAALGEPEKAFERYEQALSLHRETGNRLHESDTLLAIGDLHARLGEPRKALGPYEQSLLLQRTGGDRWSEAYALSGLGRAYTSLGDPQKGFEHQTQALALFREIGDRRGEAHARQGLARAELARGRLDEARRQVEAALALVESVRAGVVSPQLRATYLATASDYYELYIETLMRLDVARPGEGFAARAFEAAERRRARSLVELLAEAQVDLRRGAAPELLERERDLVRRLNAKAQRQLQLLAQKAPAERHARLSAEITEIEAEYDQLRARMRRENPAYAALAQPSPLDLAAVQRQLLDRETLLVEYSLGRERSYLWAVTHDALKTYELPRAEEIESAARQLHQLITARSLAGPDETRQQRAERIAQADARLPAAARRLSDLVLAPAAAELKGRRLAVVADGALQYVPFGMLPEPQTQGPGAGSREPAQADAGRPLIVGHEVVSLPSASTLAVQRRGLEGRPLAPNRIAVFADPVFDAGDARFKRAGAVKAAAAEPAPAADGAATRLLEHTAAAGLRIGRLPFTRREAEQILSAARGGRHLLALDFKASRATAMAGDLSRYRYVHFATHGYLDSVRGDLSALVLSTVDERGRVQNGFLRANEIYNLDLPAELVVLSACQTGLGREVRGEGVWGLTRGFMYAGAARVVVSLWNVNDRATSELMAKFYAKMLREQQRPAAALRAAQVEMLGHEQWQSPYFWAAFTLQGEWR